MAEEEFFGRIINPGFNSHYFELCEICEKRAPNWIESRQDQSVSEIRLSCNECHNEYIAKLDQVPITNNDAEFEIYDEQPEEVENITPIERPAWMQEFIDEGTKDGAIENIGGSEDAVNNIDSYNKLDDSEISVENEQSLNDVSDELSNIPATWSAGFIKEALFGLNPEEWLDRQNSYSKDNIELTIFTLAGMSSNQVTNVKISAIHCLNAAITKFPEKKEKIIQSISRFIDDIDEIVSNYAQEMIDASK